MDQENTAVEPIVFIAAVLESQCQRFTLCRADTAGHWDLFDDGPGGEQDHSDYIGEFDSLADAMVMARAIPLIEARKKGPAVNYQITEPEEGS